MRDIGDVYVSGIKRRFYIGCITALIGFPCLGGLIWFILSNPGNGLKDIDPESPQTLTIIAVIISVVIGLGIPVVLSFFLIKRRAQQFDTIFIPLGFTGSMYLLNGRQYHRMDGNTRVSIYIFRGPTVEIRMTVPVDAEFRVLKENAFPVTVGTTLGAGAIRASDPELTSLVFFPEDSSWLPRFLLNTNAAGSIASLMNTGGEWAVFRRLELQKGELSLHLNRSREWNAFPITTSDVAMWIRQMNLLSNELQAEGLPEADMAVSASRLQTKQGLNHFVMVVILAIMVILPVCMIVAIAISIWMVGSG